MMQLPNRNGKQENNYNQMIFEGKTIICQQGNSAIFVCTSSSCNGSLFFCSKNCPCFAPHRSSCSFKNIKELSNGIQSLLKRNFRKDMKGDSIEVVARTAKQMKPVTSNAPFCFTYCEMDPKKHYDMEFNIKSLKGCIGVGVLHKPTILKNRYQFMPNEDYINHGAYMLLTNGYQYSHSSLDDNFQQYRGIILSQGMKVRIFSLEQEIFFEQGGKQVKMRVPEEEISDLIYGVYLYNEGDEVEVLVKE